VRAGGAWRILPKDFRPWETVYGYFRDGRKDGTLTGLHDALREQVRTKHEQRNSEPSAGIVDSQSVKGADTVVSPIVSPNPPSAMQRLHAGVDTTVIALWLGHETTRTTQIYLHADLALKERALAHTAPPNVPSGRYRAPDTLIAFLNSM